MSQESPKALKVDVDSRSGFCGGVIRAISKAEEYLAGGGLKLYSLGAIVHNEEELSRLRAKGLESVGDVDEVPQGAPILIRAHGVPPEIYSRAGGHQIIDCTCPVVLRLQKDIKNAYEAQKASGRPGKVVIFGKKGHPEVLGLVGQTQGRALVLEDVPQMEGAFASGELTPGMDVELFSQTTKSPDGYADLRRCLSERLEGRLEVHDTICSQVATRHAHLSEFARSHDCVVFVSGRTSSNGKVLCDLCRSVNPRTYRVGSAEELKGEWFSPGESVGVCGATSTPRWLLEKVAFAIMETNH